jgi:hypothetical protein
MSAVYNYVLIYGLTYGALLILDALILAAVTGHMSRGYWSAASYSGFI